MGTYLNLRAAPGRADEINDAYARRGLGSFLVYSEKIIMSEIAYIHSPDGSAQAHLRAGLNSVEDWNQCFPSCAANMGSIALSVSEDGDGGERALIRAQVAFVVEHCVDFASIEGMHDAARLGVCTRSAAAALRQHTHEATNPTFSSLPTGAGSLRGLYRSCVEHDRPDLWAAYLKFSTAPDNESWELLRTKVLPWRPGKTVWISVEELATSRDGVGYGLYGRFRDGRFPDEPLVRDAICTGIATGSGATRLLVKLTLTTREGRKGIDVLTSKEPMVWDNSDGDDETIAARFEVIHSDDSSASHVVDTYTVDGDAWRTIESEGDLRQIVGDVLSGVPLSTAVTTQVAAATAAI